MMASNFLDPSNGSTDSERGKNSEYHYRHFKLLCGGEFSCAKSWYVATSYLTLKTGTR